MRFTLSVLVLASSGATAVAQCQDVVSPFDSRMCVGRLEIPACSAITGAALSCVLFTSEDCSDGPFIGSSSSTGSDDFCFGASPVVVRSLLCQNVDAPRDWLLDMQSCNQGGGYVMRIMDKAGFAFSDDVGYT